MEVREDVMTEELVKQYQEKQDKQIFNELFTRCHKSMLHFLLGKRLNIDDAEDLLQDYFFREFEKTILSYRFDSKRSFINYVKQIVLYRFISHQKRRRKKLDHEVNLDETIDQVKFNSHNGQLEEEALISVARDEIKDFFKDMVLGIKNENHRNAIILRLCLPIKLSNEEISELLDCQQTAYSTWVYRGILELQSKVTELKDKMPLNLEGMLKFIKGDSFSIKPEVLNHIDDEKRREIVSAFFFAKKTYSDLSELHQLDEVQVKLEIRKGLFELITLLNKRELLFRQGEDEMLHQDDVLNFIDHLEDTLSMDAEGIMTRSSVTTGDKDMDHLLTAMYSLYQNDEVNLKPISLKEQLLQYIKDKGISMQDVQNEYGLTMSEMNMILTGQVLEEKTLSKLHFLSFEISEAPVLSDDEFEKLNDKLLNEYHRKQI